MENYLMPYMEKSQINTDLEIFSTQNRIKITPKIEQKTIMPK